MVMYCSKDVWLTECVDFPCYMTNQEFRPQTTEQLLEQHNSLFITCKVLQNDLESQKLAISLGFVQINNQLTFACRQDNLVKLNEVDKLSFVFSCTNELGSELVRFAPFFLTDRFRQDVRLPKVWSMLIKSKWLKAPKENKSVLLAKLKNKIVGFVLLKQLNHALIIDLIAVDPRHRGKKIGSQLLAELKRHLGKEQRLEVGTQCNNLAAIQLYSSNGFTCVMNKKVYHYFNHCNE